jgi:hypothetical protein
MWPWYGYWNPWGWGWSRWCLYTCPWAPIPRAEERAMLEEQAQALENELEIIRERLAELKGKKQEVKNA